MKTKTKAGHSGNNPQGMTLTPYLLQDQISPVQQIPTACFGSTVVLSTAHPWD
jgi:hypothetical protein